VGTIVVASSAAPAETWRFTTLARALRVRGHQVIEDREGGSAPIRFARLMTLCRDAELLIAGPDMVLAGVASACRIPFLCVVLEPASLAHVDYRPLTSPPPRGQLRVLASSAHFTVPDLTLYEDLRVTGFIFENSAEEPPLPAALQNWLAEESTPILLCVGNPPAVSEAAALLGWRLRLQTEPHSMLFSQAAAIIHEGGIAPTAEALRAGKPMVILPRQQAEYFNARAVRRLGVGAALRPEGLRPATLASVLERLVASKETRRRAAELARKLKTDDGLDAVCALAEMLVRSFRGSGAASIF
jgi:hypothetical protein